MKRDSESAVRTTSLHPEKVIMSVSVSTSEWYYQNQSGHLKCSLFWLLYSGEFSREKTFTKFHGFVAIRKIFLCEIWGRGTFDAAKASNLRKFSPRKLYFSPICESFKFPVTVSKLHTEWSRSGVCVGRHLQPKSCHGTFLCTKNCKTQLLAVEQLLACGTSALIVTSGVSCQAQVCFILCK